MSLNPDAPLARGYAMVEDQGGALVPSAAAAAGTSPLIIKFRDGAVTVHQGAEPPARPKRRAAKPPAGQDSLF